MENVLAQVFSWDQKDHTYRSFVGSREIPSRKDQDGLYQKRAKARMQLKAISVLAQELLVSPRAVGKYQKMEGPEQFRAIVRRAFEYAALIVDEGGAWVREQYPELFEEVE